MKKRNKIAVLLLVTIMLASIAIPGFAENPGAAADFKGLVAHWKFDGDLKDSTQFHNDGTNTGNISYIDAVFGKGLKLDGNSYITVPNSQSLNITDTITISLWIYKEDMRDISAGAPYVTKAAQGHNGACPYTLREWWFLKPQLSCCGDKASFDATSEKQFDIKKWTLLTATFDGKLVKIYKDNELVKMNKKSGSMYSSDGELYIGFADFMHKDNYFKGIMDDLRIYNTALSYDDVNNLYKQGIADTDIEILHELGEMDDFEYAVNSTGTGNAIVTPLKKLVAFYRFEGSGSDASKSGNDGTAMDSNGGITYVDGIAGKGAKFNGFSYFEVNDSHSLDLDNEFTIGVWLCKDNAEAIEQPVVVKYGNSLNKNEYSYYLNDHQINIKTFDKGGGQRYLNNGYKSVRDKWFYLAATYDGKNIKTYINGELTQIKACTGTIAHSFLPLWIGTFNTAFGTKYFNGIMDELRIYNYAMDEKQVKKLYDLRDKITVAGPVKAGGTSAILTAMKVNQSIQLTATKLSYVYTAPSVTHVYRVPSAGSLDGMDSFTSINVTNSSTYTSSNTSVVTISKIGKVTAVGAGTATITVKCGTLVTSYSVKVTK